MRLGLFNWTSDLSGEPEYPPFFDNLRISEDDKIGAEGTAAYDAITNARGNCSVLIDGGGGFDSTDIGSMEHLNTISNDFFPLFSMSEYAPDSFANTFSPKSFKSVSKTTLSREDAWGELKGIYLILSEAFMISWEAPYISSPYAPHTEMRYQNQNKALPTPPDVANAYWSRYKPAVKEKFEKDPDGWHLATTGFTIKQVRDNFVFWHSEECYVCVNPYWNTRAVELLTAQTPSRMRRFNDCIRSKLDAGERVKNSLESIDAALNRIGSSLNK